MMRTMNEWTRRIFAFGIWVLIVCVIVVSIQVQQKNNNIKHVEEVAAEIQKSVDELKSSPKLPKEVHAGIKEALIRLERIQAILLQLKTEVVNAHK